MFNQEYQICLGSLIILVKNIKEDLFRILTRFVLIWIMG